MTRQLLIVTLTVVMVAPPLPAMAQDMCTPCFQEYRLVPQTIYEEKPCTTQRLQTETIIEERQIVRYRPVCETSTKERRYTVTKPVVQTSTREERKTVMKPVWEVRYVDKSYDRTRYVAQTSSRTERRVVNRPVVETQMRQEQRVVQKPVTTTVLQDQVSTSYKPVTTYYQRTVDQGGFVDQLQYQPGDVRHRLRWQKAQCKKDPLTGAGGVQRAGFYWIPRELPGTYTTNRVYVPNPVVQQTAQTQYVPEQVVQKVPVNVTTMQAETQVRQVPIQVTRIQQEEQVREVPVTVQRPVVERVPRFVPQYRCRWEPQEYVRQVPVNTYKYVSEERVEQIPVRTYKMVAEYQTVEVPRKQSHWVEETTMRVVPRTIMMKIPLSEPCGAQASYSVISNSPTEYNVRTVSDSEVASDWHPSSDIVDVPVVSDSDANQLSIEPPIVESDSAADQQPELAPIPRGSRPTIESSGRSIERAQREAPQKPAAPLLILSVK